MKIKIAFKIIIGILVLPLMLFIDLSYFLLCGSDRLLFATKQILDTIEGNLMLIDK